MGANWGTLVQEILEEGNKLGSTVTETNRVQRAICRALAFFRDQRLITLEGRWSVTLVANQNAYQNVGLVSGIPITLTGAFEALATSSITTSEDGTVAGNPFSPPNFMYPVGQTIDLDRGGLPTNRWELVWVPPEEIDVYRRYYDYVSQPDYWTWFDNTLELYPTPDQSGDIVRGRGVFDHGVPGSYFDGTNWNFTIPAVGGTRDGNAMSNDWPHVVASNGGGIVHQDIPHFWVGGPGYPCLRAYCLWQLLTGVWQSRPEVAAGWRQQYEEHLKSLQRRHNVANGARQILPWRGEGWY